MKFNFKTLRKDWCFGVGLGGRGYHLKINGRLASPSSAEKSDEKCWPLTSTVTPSKTLGTSRKGAWGNVRVRSWRQVKRCRGQFIHKLAAAMVSYQCKAFTTPVTV